MHQRLTIEHFEDLPRARRYGHYISASCLWAPENHDDGEDKHPSMLVFEDGWFRCLSCGVVGDYDKLWRKFQGWQGGIESAEDVSWKPPRTPDIYDLDQFAADAHELLVSSGAKRWYLRMRGVQDQIVPLSLGWWDGWYVIPVFGKTGNVRTVVLRAGHHIQEATGQRFYIPRNAPKIPYVPNWKRLSRANSIAVVFGIFDAIALDKLGFPVVSPLAGKNSMDPAWLNEYRVPIVVVPDKGEEADAFKLAAKFGWRGRVVRLPYPPGCKDPADYLAAGKDEQLLKQLWSKLK